MLSFAIIISKREIVYINLHADTLSSSKFIYVRQCVNFCSCIMRVSHLHLHGLLLLLDQPIHTAFHSGVVILFIFQHFHTFYCSCFAYTLASSHFVFPCPCSSLPLFVLSSFHFRRLVFLFSS